MKAAQQVRDEGIEPILLGKKNLILELIEENALELEGVTIIDPKSDEDKRRYGSEFSLKNANEKGVSQFEARKLMRETTLGQC